MSNKEFFWPESWVKEFSMNTTKNALNALRATDTDKSMEDFKKSKQVPNKEKDYEILSVANPNREGWSCDKTDV